MTLSLIPQTTKGESALVNSTQHSGALLCVGPRTGPGDTETISRSGFFGCK